MIANCPRGLGILETPKEVVEEGQMYLHRFRVGVEDEVARKVEVMFQRR